VLRVLSASSAYPIITSPREVDGIRYFDGGLSDPFPVKKALDDGHEEVITIFNKPNNSAMNLGKGARIGRRLILASGILPPAINQTIRDYEKNREKLYRDIDDHRVRMILPKVKNPVRKITDTNRGRINAAFDMGVIDAQEFLETFA